MVQRIFIFFIAIFIGFSCASSKKAAEISIGSWDYVIKGTPDGDTEGVLIIEKEGDNYTGSLNTSQGSLPLDDVEIEDNVLTSSFNYSGYTIDMTGTFEGDAFDGKCSVEYNDFPMTAVRKK